MISKLCSVNKGAFIMLKRFLPSTLSHYNVYFESFTMMRLSSPLPQMYASSERWASSHRSGMELIQEKSVCLHPRAPCEQMSGCISIMDLSGPAVTFSLGNFFFLAQPWFYKKDRLLTSAFQWKLFTFFILQSVIQRKKKKWNIQRLPNSSLGAIVLKVNFEHAIFKPDTITATCWIPPHLLFYEDVNSHPSNHLLPSGHTPPCWKTKDSETKSL